MLPVFSVLRKTVRCLRAGLTDDGHVWKYSHTLVRFDGITSDIFECDRCTARSMLIFGVRVNLGYPRRFIPPCDEYLVMGIMDE